MEDIKKILITRTNKEDGSIAYTLVIDGDVLSSETGIFNCISEMIKEVAGKFN